MIEIAGTIIEVRNGSLLDQRDLEVIVNAANKSMRGGGGIDGAVHRAAGPGLMEELRNLAPEGCETGDVIVTGGHHLPFKYIFHTPGPRWRGGDHSELEQLAECYRRCLEKAAHLNVRSIGFCSISTGIYGNPLELAAPVAVKTVASYVTEHPGEMDRVVFAMYADHEHLAFVEALQPEDGEA